MTTPYTETQRVQLINLAEQLDPRNNEHVTPCFVIDQIRAFNIPVIKDLDQCILQKIKEDPNCFCMLGRGWHSDKRGHEIESSRALTCATTHCRAGWAIVLAGQKGVEISTITSPYYAGILIYAASMPTFPIPDFYAEDEEAIADMEARVKAM